MDGIASHLSTLLPALRRQGWLPHMVVGMIDCPEVNRPTLEKIKSAAETFMLDETFACHGRLGPAMICRQAWRLGYLCREHDCRIIHLRGRALGPAATLAGFRFGTRCVNVPPLAPDQTKTKLHNVLRRLGGRLLGDRVVGISREMIPHLTHTWGVPAKRICHIPHGTSLARFRSPTDAERATARDQIGVPMGAFVFSQIARVGAIKRPDTVVAATARLTQEGRDVRALLAGHCDPRERRRLDQQSVKLGIGDRVHILGHADARDVLWASDAKVLASEREGFGIAIIEAMACGVVPVRTPVEGATDQIEDRVNGLLFPVGDDGALADHLRFLMDHPDQRRRMGEAAQRKAIERFSDDAMARGTIGVYEELLDARSDTNVKGAICVD